jgi:hypothetical protein
LGKKKFPKYAIVAMTIAQKMGVQTFSPKIISILEVLKLIKP